jgi:hypothetical protein
MINPYNLNHPTFGCTIASNMVQMVSDKREFTNPGLTGEADGLKTSQRVGFYNTPDAYGPPDAKADFTALATQQTLQTQGTSSR